MFVRSQQVTKYPGTKRCSSEGSMEENNEQSAQKKDFSVKIGDYRLAFETDEIGDFYVDKARNELRESPEVIEKAVHDFKLLVEGEPGLHIPDDIEFYTKFLRPCKWYPESAFNLMKRFYRFRKNNPRYSNDLLPSKQKNILAAGLYIPLPNRTEDGCRVLLLQSGMKWNPKKISLDEMLKGAMLALDAAMAEPRTQIAGVHVIVDMEGLSLSHVTYFTPSFASAVAEWVQWCLPCRLKGIHVVNQPFIFKMLFAIFKPFLHEKTRKRIHFHGSDRSALLSMIGAQALPTSMGGKVLVQDELVGEDIWKFFCNHDEEFQEASTYGYVSEVKQ